MCLFDISNLTNAQQFRTLLVISYHNKCIGPCTILIFKNTQIFITKTYGTMYQITLLISLNQHYIPNQNPVVIFYLCRVLHMEVWKKVTMAPKQ